MSKGVITKLDFSDESLLASAERRLRAGDYMGALTMLNKRNSRYDPTCDSSILAADIYEAMGLYARAADAWYHFLDTCNEADFAEGYEGLAVAFMNMGNEAQSALYYHKMLSEENEVSEEEKAEILSLFLKEEPQTPPLRLVYSVEGGEDCSEEVNRGIFHLKTGNLKEARKYLSQVTKGCKDYPSAVGLMAMCALMDGDGETAERECRELLEEFPDNVQALTTYCAVLSEKKDKKAAQEVAMRLYAVKTEEGDELYKIATALCETGLDEQAYEKLSVLIERAKYDRNLLWLYSVAAYKTERYRDACDALSRLTTVYPRAAVAEHYLVRIRELLDGGDEKPEMSYFYRVPEVEYTTVISFLTAMADAPDEQLEELAALSETDEVFRIAFDEMEGRDEKLQTLAVKVAIRARADAFLREILLDYEGNDLIKFYILHGLTARNEENSFGTVICGLYKEFFVHKIQIGSRKRKAFLQAFADVYSKFALICEENESKIVCAAEEVYRVLADTEAYSLMEEREALAAVLYRESHLRRGERSLEKIADLFSAESQKVRDILDLIL